MSTAVTLRLDNGTPGRHPCVIWCDACGKTEPCSEDDATRYFLTAWPRCESCGDVMFYGLAEPEPAAPSPDIADAEPQ
jgi:hypothetical protein